MKLSESSRWICGLGILGLVCAISPQRAEADPCGMVPPIYVGNDTPIARVADPAVE